MTIGKEIETLGLLTDKYELTMAQAYFSEAQKKALTNTKEGSSTAPIVEPVSTCELYFRKNPFEGGYAVNAGLSDVMDYLSKFRFSDSDIEYLRTQTQLDGHSPMYTEEFLQYLRNLTLCCDIDAIPEGTVVFANQPLLRITGPRTQVQLLETALLNIVNFQTLIATKAARVKSQCGKQKLLEFGLRRAQDQGGLAASRAAYIGGADASSNELAGKELGIPTTGTHAHAFVMSYSDELTAFRAYADALPGNCIFLVDTYDVKQGIENAITVGKELRERGHEMVGIRLDSGDLAKLSKQARKRLNEERFPNAIIVASNDLNEQTIASLKDQGAPIDAWGVGTQLTTGGNQSALGGVYKVVATQNEELSFEPKIKISDNVEKTTNPGRHQVRRYYREQYNDHGTKSREFLCDVMYDIDLGLKSDAEGNVIMVNPQDANNLQAIAHDAPYEDLLVPIYRRGTLIYESPTLADIKERAQKELDAIKPESKRLLNPEPYLSCFAENFHQQKIEMIRRLRGVRKLITDGLTAAGQRARTMLSGITARTASEEEAQATSDPVVKEKSPSL